MNPEIKAKWIAALRSGKYKQGTGQLKQEDRFCCLGVLCDLHRKECPEERQWNGGFYFDIVTTLPKEVIFWAGLNEHNPALGDFTCAIHNDGCIETCPRKSFTEIADLIEQHL